MAVPLLLYGRSLGLSHAEAEDVLHDTFGALLRLDRVPRELEGYCRRAFRNRALNLRRNWVRRLAREWQTRAWFEESASTDPRERRMMRELARLPEEQREVVVLRIWHGCTYKTISELTGVSPHTVAGRYRYGMNRLKHWMAGEYEEEPECAGGDAGCLDPAASV